MTTGQTILPAATGEVLASQLAVDRPRTGLFACLRLVPLPIVIFFLAILVPVERSFYVGSLRLTAYRVWLLLAFLPCLFGLLSGACGKPRLCDKLIIFHVIWAFIALWVHHGFSLAMESGGIYILEALGSYLLARRYIRDADSFRGFVALLALLVVLLAVFTVPESVTGTHYLRPTAVSIGRRHGLERAYGPFEHPILYGVFCASALSLAYYALYLGERAQFRKFFLLSGIILSTVVSVSSGAVAAIATQLILIGWDWLTREMPRRWRLLGILTVAAYVTVDLISNRTPIRVGLSYLTFSEETAYGRLVIWDAGTAEVAKSPYFGIGFSEWEHPTWMSNSMDNFWLWIAVTFGLPACIALMWSVFSIAYRLAKSKASELSFRYMRKAWLFSVLGVSVAGATVHFWNALFVLFMFLVGAGVCLLGTETNKTRVA